MFYFINLLKKGTCMRGITHMHGSRGMIVRMNVRTTKLSFSENTNQKLNSAYANMRTIE